MVFHVQSLITRVLDPPTYSHQSDANCGKIRYVSDPYGCSDHSNLEMEAKCWKKTLSYLNLNISRTKNDRNKL